MCVYIYEYISNSTHKVRQLQTMKIPWKSTEEREKNSSRTPFGPTLELILSISWGKINEEPHKHMKHN